MMGHWLQFVASMMVQASNRGSASSQIHCPHAHSLSFPEEAIGPLNSDSDSQMARLPLLKTHSYFQLLQVVLKLSVISRKEKVQWKIQHYFCYRLMLYFILGNIHLAGVQLGGSGGHAPPVRKIREENCLGNAFKMVKKFD